MPSEKKKTSHATLCGVSLQVSCSHHDILRNYSHGYKQQLLTLTNIKLQKH